MKKRKRIIKDKKLRGEWVETVFMERATEYGLPVSKPWGEMSSFDFVVGKPRRFVSVQVKSTICRLDTGYICTVRGGHKAYRAGSFDFLAVYLPLEDTWYIIPAELIRGKGSITLYPHSKTAKYEPYREAWHLLKEATAVGEEAQSTEAGAEAESVAGPPAVAVARMQTAMNSFKRYLERGNVLPQKPGDEV